MDFSGGSGDAPPRSSSAPRLRRKVSPQEASGTPAVALDRIEKMRMLEQERRAMQVGRVTPDDRFKWLVATIVVGAATQVVAFFTGNALASAVSTAIVVAGLYTIVTQSSLLYPWFLSKARFYRLRGSSAEAPVRASCCGMLCALFGAGSCLPCSEVLTACGCGPRGGRALHEVWLGLEMLKADDAGKDPEDWPRHDVPADLAALAASESAALKAARVTPGERLRWALVQVALWVVTIGMSARGATSLATGQRDFGQPGSGVPGSLMLAGVLVLAWAAIDTYVLVFESSTPAALLCTGARYYQRREHSGEAPKRATLRQVIMMRWVAPLVSASPPLPLLCGCGPRDGRDFPEIWCDAEMLRDADVRAAAAAADGRE